MGQGEEDQVRRGQPAGLGGLEDPAGQPGQMRMQGGHWGTRAAARGHRAKFEVRVGGDEAEQLSPGVTAGTGHGDPDSHRVLLRPLAAQMCRARAWLPAYSQNYAV